MSGVLIRCHFSGCALHFAAGGNISLYLRHKATDSCYKILRKIQTFRNAHEKCSSNWDEIKCWHFQIFSPLVWQHFWYIKAFFYLLLLTFLIYTNASKETRPNIQLMQQMKKCFQWIPKVFSKSSPRK